MSEESKDLSPRDRPPDASDDPQGLTDNTTVPDERGGEAAPSTSSSDGQPSPTPIEGGSTSPDADLKKTSEEELRWCKKCRTHKPQDQFARNRKSKTGYFYSCKSCMGRHLAIARASRPERPRMKDPTARGPRGSTRESRQLRVRKLLQETLWRLMNEPKKYNITDTVEQFADALAYHVCPDLRPEEAHEPVIV